MSHAEVHESTGRTSLRGLGRVLGRLVDLSSSLARSAGGAHRAAGPAKAPAPRRPHAAPMNDPTTLGAARSSYYQVNGFGDDGGDALAWVPIKVWKLTLRIPNTAGRRRAVRVHDLHHVLTGYQTDLAGESEIAAWELASGCRQMPAAFVLNAFALALGTVIAPIRVTRAWARGRSTRNLYGDSGIDQLLTREVAEVRARLGLIDAAPRVRVRDVVAMTCVALPPLAILGALVVTPIAGLALLVNALI